MKKEKVVGLAVEKVEKVNSVKRNMDKTIMTFSVNMMTIVTKLQELIWFGHSFSRKSINESQVFNFNHELLRVRPDHVMDSCLSKRTDIDVLSSW